MERIAIAFALASLSGFVDVICLMLFSSFAALQTGNMVHIGIALAKFTNFAALAESVTYNLAVLASHFCAVYLFCALIDRCPRPLLVGAPVLGFFTATAGIMHHLTDGSKWSACFVSASFGAMNFSTSPNTPLEGKLFTMVSLATGNLQKCAKMCYRASAGYTFTPQERLTTQIASAVVIGTLLGALVGGISCTYDVAQKDDLLIFAGIWQCAVLLLHDWILRPHLATGSAALLEPLATAAPPTVTV